MDEKLLLPVWSVVDAEPGQLNDHWTLAVDADASIQSVTFFDRWTIESYYSKDQTAIYMLMFDDTLDMEVVCVAEFDDARINNPATFKAFAMYYFLDFVKSEGITKVVEPEQE